MYYLENQLYLEVDIEQEYLIVFEHHMVLVKMLLQYMDKEFVYLQYMESVETVDMNTEMDFLHQQYKESVETADMNTEMDFLHQQYKEFDLVQSQQEQYQDFYWHMYQEFFQLLDILQVVFLVQYMDMDLSLIHI